MRYKNKTIISVLIGIILFGISCNTLGNFEKIKIGMDRATVIKIAGEALKRRNGELHQGVFWGPQEGIDPTTLNEKREYEEWTYKESGDIFLIWFGGHNRNKNKWKVIGKTSYPEGAVF